MSNESNRDVRLRLAWIDLEMTGLDPGRDSILEIATLVTDAELEILAEGPVFAIGHGEAVLADMDEWNTETHMASGLWQRVLDSEVSLKEAEQGTLEFLESWLEPGTSPMCGNSICQDRRFLHRLMPRLESFFHYRNLDVSSVKELARRWAPSVLDGLQKANRHEAMADIRESVEELRYYRRFMGRIGGMESR